MVWIWCIAGKTFVTTDKQGAVDFLLFFTLIITKKYWWQSEKIILHQNINQCLNRFSRYEAKLSTLRFFSWFRNNDALLLFFRFLIIPTKF